MIDAPDSRELILAAAKRLFVEQGFRGISMRQIADAVGVTKAAIYYHFHDKEDLFLAILESYLTELATLIDTSAAGADTGRGQITAIVHRILMQPVEQRAVLRLASQEVTHLSDAHRGRFMEMYFQCFIGRITALLQAAMTSGELRPVDPQLATWTLLGMMYPYFHMSPVAGPAPTTERIDELVSIYFDGLAR